jgi:hypothetical protein
MNGRVVGSSDCQGPNESFSDATSKLEFPQALMRLRLAPGEEPSVLFFQIADLSNRYGIYNHPEQQVIDLALANRAGRTRERAWTQDEVEDCLETHQRQVHPYEEDGDRKGRKSDKNGGTEITSQGATVPKRNCWKCGQSGHRKKIVHKQNMIAVITNRLRRADDVPKAGRIPKIPTEDLIG